MSFSIGSMVDQSGLIKALEEYVVVEMIPGGIRYTAPSDLDTKLNEIVRKFIPNTKFQTQQNATQSTPTNPTRGKELTVWAINKLCSYLASPFVAVASCISDLYYSRFPKPSPTELAFSEAVDRIDVVSVFKRYNKTDQAVAAREVVNQFYTEASKIASSFLEKKTDFNTSDIPGRLLSLLFQKQSSKKSSKNTYSHFHYILDEVVKRHLSKGDFAVFDLLLHQCDSQVLVKPYMQQIYDGMCEHLPDSTSIFTTNYKAKIKDLYEEIINSETSVACSYLRYMALSKRFDLLDQENTIEKAVASYRDLTEKIAEQSSTQRQAQKELLRKKDNLTALSAISEDLQAAKSALEQSHDKKSAIQTLMHLYGRNYDRATTKGDSKLGRDLSQPLCRGLERGLELFLDEDHLEMLYELPYSLLLRESDFENFSQGDTQNAIKFIEPCIIFFKKISSKTAQEKTNLEQQIDSLNNEIQKMQINQAQLKDKYADQVIYPERDGVSLRASDDIDLEAFLEENGPQGERYTLEYFQQVAKEMQSSI